jgi:hypothetical protein
MSNDTAQAQAQETQAPDLPAAPAARGIGRPTTYTPATAQLIAARLADGETLSSICRTPGMPARQTVHQWRMRIPAFADLYARAREIGMESMGDDLLEIADDDTLDLDEDGRPNSANVQRSRLQVDARKFLMSKLAPKVYGDRIEHQHSGTVESVVTLSDKERMRRLATFLAMDERAGITVEGELGTSEEPVTLPASPTLPDRPGADDPGAIDEPRTRDDDV